MARYKDYNYDQLKLLPISFSRQILPGTFEHSLDHIVSHELNLSVFDARYHNDETGAPAYDPAILLKIVLYAYSRGITSQNNRGRTTVLRKVIFHNVGFAGTSGRSRRLPWRSVLGRVLLLNPKPGSNVKTPG